MIARVGVVWPCQIEIDVYVRAGRQLRPLSQACPACKGGAGRAGRLPPSAPSPRPDRTALDLAWPFANPATGPTRCSRTSSSRITETRPTRSTLCSTPVSSWTFPPQPVAAGTPVSSNSDVLRSAPASAAVGFGGSVRDMRVDRLLVALWRAVRRASDMIPSPWRILNIMSGGSWVCHRVNSSRRLFGHFPRPP